MLFRSTLLIVSNGESSAYQVGRAFLITQCHCMMSLTVEISLSSLSGHKTSFGHGFCPIPKKFNRIAPGPTLLRLRRDFVAFGEANATHPPPRTTAHARRTTRRTSTEATAHHGARHGAREPASPGRWGGHMSTKCSMSEENAPNVKKHKQNQNVWRGQNC